MSEAEVVKIVQSLGPSWIDITRTIALVVLALTAIFTAKFALKQAENAVRQAHAGFLLELDRRWEGHEMIESRVEYNKLSEEIKNDIFNNFSQLSHKDMELKEEELFENKFHEIKNGNVNRYAKLMRLCGVFETVGFLVNRKFVMFSEINDLFHGSIIPVGAAFEKHIKKRD